MSSSLSPSLSTSVSLSVSSFTSVSLSQFLTLSSLLIFVLFLFPLYPFQRNYTNTVTKVVTPGSTVAYTLSIPSTSTNKKDAIKYIMNLRSKKGALKLAIPEGLNPLLKPSLFYGNLSTVPIELKAQNTTL